MFDKNPPHRHLSRLAEIRIDPAIYFITCCSYRRAPLLADATVVQILIDEWKAAALHYGWHVGWYVVLPDHCHFFCTAGSSGADLSKFVGSWKQYSSKRIKAVLGLGHAVWQREFFDHLLRSNESYEEKWQYVRMNPVRAGLTAKPESWPFMGRIEDLGCL